MIDADARSAVRTTSAGTDSDMLARINATPVTPDMLACAIAAFAALPDDKRGDFGQRMATLLRALRPDISRPHLIATAIAIDFRLRALARLVESTFVQGCEVDLVTRRQTIAAAVLRVASVEPLMRNASGLATFEGQSFKTRLLH